jgi:hypothetical protein
MKRIIYFLILVTLIAACQKRQLPVKSRYTPVNVGTSANDGTGDNLRAAFQKVNAGFVDVYDSLGNIYTEAQTQAVINDTIEARITAATDISSIAWLKADSNTNGNPVTLTYFNANAGTGGGGYDVDKVEFIVGTTSGAPANADTSFTISQLANKEITLYRGTTADLHRQYLNRTATNTITGYRFNSSGVIVVRPAWATGDRAYIEGIPTANANWLTLSSDAAYFTETFEATGYDNAVWSESVGSGSFVDEDETGVTPPSGGGSQVLQITKVSPNFAAAAICTLPADQVVSYLTYYVYINAHGLASSENRDIMSTWLDGYGDDISLMNLYVDSYDSNNLKFVFEINDDGTGTTAVAWPGAGSAVALNTWYKVNIKYDVTGDAYEVKITPDGGAEATVMSGSLTATHPTAGIRIIKLGNNTDSETMNIYFDNVAVGTTAYPTF